VKKLVTEATTTRIAMILNRGRFQKRGICIDFSAMKWSDQTSFYGHKSLFLSKEAFNARQY
jgi:hypothetical protein